MIPTVTWPKAAPAGEAVIQVRVPPAILRVTQLQVTQEILAVTWLRAVQAVPHRRLAAVPAVT